MPAGCGAGAAGCAATRCGSATAAVARPTTASTPIRAITIPGCIGAAGPETPHPLGLHDLDGSSERDDARHPDDVGVIDPDAAVRAGRPERIGQARTVASVDRDAPGAAAIVEQHVREGGEMQRPGAEEPFRVRLLQLLVDRIEAARRGRCRGTDHRGEAALL